MSTPANDPLALASSFAASPAAPAESSVASSLEPPPLPTFSMEPFTFGGYAATAGELSGVGFWPRVAARMVDLVAHYLIGICTGMFFGFLIGVAAALTRQPSGPLIQKLMGGGVGVFLFATLGFAAYETVFESVHGSTLGKRMLSMVVVQEDGTPCRLGPALIRSLAYFLDALFFGVIGYMAMQNSQQEQRHGDKWAHTVVCKRSGVKPENLRGGGRFAAALLLAAMADSAILMSGFVVNLVA